MHPSEPTPPTSAARVAPSSAQEALELRNAEAFMEDLARTSAAALSTSTPVSCAITTQRGDQQTSVAWSDGWASALDEIQYEIDIGPCLHSLRTQEIVLIEDTEHDKIWEAWRGRALEAGVMSSLAVPVPPVDGVLAAFNYYAREKHAFGPEEVERAEVQAQQAVRAIGLVAWLVEQEVQVEQLRAALGSRSVIDQALGVIMAQNRCDADQAFFILRQASHNRNLKLRKVALEVVERATGKPAVLPPPFRTRR